MTTSTSDFRSVLTGFLLGDGDKWAERIINSYGEPQRHYHTIKHIESMWDLWTTLNTQCTIEEDTVVKLAILFHE